MKNFKKIIILVISITFILVNCNTFQKGITAPKTDEKLKQMASTSLNSKVVAGNRDFLAEIAVDAVKTILADGKANIDDIAVSQQQGKSITDSKIIKGVILDKEVVHSGMPKKVKNAKKL